MTQYGDTTDVGGGSVGAGGGCPPPEGYQTEGREFRGLQE